MSRFKWSKQNEQLFWECCFLAVYAVLLTKSLLETSQLHLVFEAHADQRNSYFLWIRLFAVTVLLARAVRTERWQWRELLLGGFFLICLWRCYQVTGYEEVMDLAIVVLGARQVSFRRILLVHVTVSAVLIAALVLASQLGYVDDWIFSAYRNGELLEKHSYGFLYPNEFGAHVFFLFLGWACLRREKITVFELAAMVLCAFLLLHFCYSRTNFLCILFLAAGMLVIKLLARIPQIAQKGVMRAAGVVLALVPLVCCAVILVLSLLYRGDNAFLVRLNDWLSGRLMLSRAGFDNYGVKLFGQPIVMYGMSPTMDWSQYNFLDSSYIMLLIRCGLASFVSVAVMIAVINVRALRRRDFVLLFVMAVCCMQCIMEHHLYDIAYNPLLLAVFAAFPALWAGERVDREKRLCTEEQAKAG